MVTCYRTGYAGTGEKLEERGRGGEGAGGEGAGLETTSEAL